MFVVTANTPETIHRALLDRMEIIRLPGYTEFEKLQIAKAHLVPKQMAECGLLGKVNVSLPDDVLMTVIRNYTDESGVRLLEQKIATILRKLATDYLLSDKDKRQTEFTVTEDFTKKTLGVEVYRKDKARKTQAGVSIGLAWTPTGGHILFIETAKYKSRQEKRISQTGSLGEVFKESIKICLTLLRNRLGDREEFDEHVFHVHVPDGAVSKDGPSAGIAIFCALYSLITGKKIKEKLAMTGELNLEGLVLPIGGVREKVIAAERAGITNVILPKENAAEAELVTDEVKKKIGFHFVEQIDGVIKIAFEEEGITGGK